MIRNFCATRSFAASFAICLIIPASLLAQAGVAIVDINQIFDKHPVFPGELDRLRVEAESLQSSVMQQRQQLAAQAEQLSLVYQIGTPEYSDKEKSLAMENAKLELDAREKMRLLMRREARLHYDTYTEINQMISQYCQQFNTQIVLRHAAVQVNEKDPESIMQQVNASVIWHRPDRDITPQILRQMGQVKSSVPAAQASSPKQ